MNDMIAAIIAHEMTVRNSIEMIRLLKEGGGDSELTSTLIEGIRHDADALNVILGNLGAGRGDVNALRKTPNTPGVRSDYCSLPPRHDSEGAG